MIANKIRTRILWSSVLLAPLYLASVGASNDEAAETVSDKRIVDCLLQGQIRKLGTTVYQAPPRPMKLPAIDCEIRGGDFLVYDRANFATSLAHWLNLAKGGDVNAQVYVGEIFERGLGRDPDYAQAAVWYAQAANAGNPVAQINLAQLYEKGLGVQENPDEAARLYRVAFGTGGSDAVGLDPGSLDDPAEKIRILEKDLQQTQVEANALRAQLAAAQDSLGKATADLGTQEQDEQRLKEELALAQSRFDAASASGGEAQAARADLDRSQQLLTEQQLTITRLREEIDRNQRQVNAYQSDFDRVAELEAQLKASTAQIDATNLELQQSRAALTESNQRFAEQQQEFEEERRQLELARNELQTDSALSADERERLQTELQARETKLETQAASLEELRLQVQGYRNESIELQSQLAQLRDKDKELVASRQEADRLRDESARLRSLLTETTEQLQAIEASSADANEIDVMQAELERVRNEAERYKSRIEELESATPVVANLAGPAIQLLEPAAFNTRGIGDLVIESANEQQIVGKITAPAGLLSLTVNDHVAAFNESNVFRTVVTLSSETTPIHIAAIDNQGKRAEQTFNLISKELRQAALKKRIPDVSFGEFHALLIGNEDYEMLPDLITPKEDIRTLGEILSQRYGYKTTIVEDGSREVIMDRMYELLGQLTSEDNLLIYYAGHGEYVTDTNRGVWLPIDANPSSPANWITNVEINDYLKQIKAKQIVVIADSCYSGALTRSAVINLRPGLTDEEYEAHLKKMSKVQARVVLTSGALAPVLDSAGPNSTHSIFAAALIDILNQNDSVLSAQDLGRTIAAKVSLAATQVGYDQEPQYAPLNHANHQGGDFFFVPKFF